MFIEDTHPQLNYLDELVRIIGWPTLICTVIWVVQKWDKGQREAKEISENAKAAADGVALVKTQMDTIITNHIVHLQTDIERLGTSNEKQVEVLQQINTSIKILVDRTPRV